MRIVLQRVAYAQVVIDEKIQGSIQQGLLLLVGIEDADTTEDADWLVGKITQLRIFPDDEGKMNHSVLDLHGEILIVSQFTLFAQTKKGNRPSFIKAARPEKAIPLYEYLIAAFKKTPLRIETGIFGADMKVSLLNDGPVTILMDSKNKE